MEFMLLGISHRTELKLLFFLIFLSIYIFILFGNILVILATLCDPILCTPMYFFLRNLAFLDICYTTVTIPKMLTNLLMEKTTISFVGCSIQMYFFLFLGTAACYTLAVMSYDRYVAICNPFHYTAIMTKRICILLVSGCWVTGMSVSLGQTVLIFSMPFCNSSVINHFFCDVLPVMKLICAESYMNEEVEVILMSVLIIFIPFTLISVSYIHIIAAIIRIPSVYGRYKAVNTCSSHLTSVFLFYGSAMFMYLRPKSNWQPDLDKLLSLLYTVVPAMLNPIVYSLSNQQVKRALRKVLGRNTISQNT